MKIRWVTRLNPHEAQSRNPIKAYFLGMYKDRNGERLEEKYVHDMFTSEFVRNVVERGNAGDCRFVDIPPGRPRMTPLQTKESGVVQPLIKYEQKGEQTCLFSSFASALYFMGLEGPAKAVAMIPKCVLKDSLLCWKALRHTMQTECPWLEQHGLKTALFDPIGDVSNYPMAMTYVARTGAYSTRLQLSAGRFSTQAVHMHFL